MISNLDLFEGYTFSDFEVATAEQIALSNGRESPVSSDFVLAVKKCREWKVMRKAMGLPEWK